MDTHAHTHMHFVQKGVCLCTHHLLLQQCKSGWYISQSGRRVHLQLTKLLQHEGGELEACGHLRGRAEGGVGREGLCEHQ